MKTFDQLREGLSHLSELKSSEKTSLDELKIGTYQSYMKKANKQIKQYNTKKYQDAFYKQHGSAAKHGSPDFQRYKKAYADDSRRIGNREKGTDRAMTAINKKRDTTGKNPERYYTKAMRRADADKQPKTRGRPRSLSYGYKKPEV